MSDPLKSIDDYDRKICRRIQSAMEDYGLPHFNDLYPAMDILQRIKDAGYTRSSGLEEIDEAEVYKVLEKVSLSKPDDFKGPIYVGGPHYLNRSAKAIASRFGRPKIKLPEDIEPLCEIVHKAYCVWRLDDGQTPYWTEGDYSKLDDRTKEADRYTVRSVLNELRRLNGLEEEGKD